MPPTFFTAPNRLLQHYDLTRRPIIVVRPVVK